MLITNLHKIIVNMQPKIVIVGAGAAGIAAASKLIKNGFTDVTVLEAENRIGGRIHSVPFEGVVVDLGAQWVHGEENNVIYQMVKDLNLLGHNSTADYQNVSFFTSDNSYFNNKTANEIHELASDVLAPKEESLKNHESVADYFKETYNDLIFSEYGDNEDIKDLAEMIEDWTSKVCLCYDPANSWTQLSPLGLTSYQHCEGDPLLHWKDKGYSTLIDIIMTNGLTKSQQELLQNSIILNKEICRIIWDRDQNQTKEVFIECTDGSKYDANHVITTLSVGVLKNHHDTLFQPSLPKYKINCIESIPLGISHKILLKFSSKWWPDNIKDFSFLWTKEDRKSLAKEFPYGPVLDGRSWLEYIFGFYTVDSHPEFLLGWMVGPMTKDVEELPDDLVKKASMFLLRKFVGRKFNILDPVNIVRSRWGTNPHFYGTYSYVGTEMVRRGATHEDLAKPLTVDGEEVVLFAGEATHSSFFSTVHGAIETGFREADRLIQRYSMQNS